MMVNYNFNLPNWEETINGYHYKMWISTCKLFSNNCTWCEIFWMLYIKHALCTFEASRLGCKTFDVKSRTYWRHIVTCHQIFVLSFETFSLSVGSISMFALSSKQLHLLSTASYLVMKALGQLYPYLSFKINCTHPYSSFV